MYILYKTNSYLNLITKLIVRSINTNNNKNKIPEDENYIKIYEDPVNQRSLIRYENNGKIGIYAWVNKINGKVYVGSGDPLYLRISDYYQSWYLNNRTNLYIVKALNKYGMENFTLVILEYTNSENLIPSEQKWIDRIKPEYNLNPSAYNSKGYKHTIESIEKMSKVAIGRKHSDEVRRLMSDNRKGKDNPFFGKKHKPETIVLFKEIAENREKFPVKGIEVEITNLDNKTTTIYSSIREAAKAIDSDIKTILRREKIQVEKGINTPYRNKYIITIKRD